MARVDPESDSVRRFIVRHYRYDPERHERRHVVVAAFDNERDFRACMENVQEEIERRKSSGDHVDPQEHASGTVYEPGHCRRAVNGRLVRRALGHGVAPGPWIDELEMPSNVAVLLAVGPAASGPGWASHVRRLIARWLGGLGRP